MGEIIVGSVIQVIAGKEKKELFLVLQLDKNNAKIVDGKKRTLSNPKIKNLKHIRLVCKQSNIADLMLENKVHDCDIIKYLKDYERQSKIK